MVAWLLCYTAQHGCARPYYMYVYGNFIFYSTLCLALYISLCCKSIHMKLYFVSTNPSCIYHSFALLLAAVVHENLALGKVATLSMPWYEKPSRIIDGNDGSYAWFWASENPASWAAITIDLKSTMRIEAVRLLIYGKCWKNCGKYSALILRENHHASVVWIWYHWVAIAYLYQPSP